MIRIVTFLCLLICLRQELFAQTTWEQKVANRFSAEYRTNVARLDQIDSTLQSLPIPYKGEPTGSGGFLSFWTRNPNKIVRVNFRWKSAYNINAISLLPLRVYLGESGSLTENAYWPEKIEILAKVGDEFTVIAEIDGSQQDLQQSLPEMVEFDAVKTSQIVVLCTKRTKETETPHYGVGFSEVMIFSGKENVAPRAIVKTTRCREDRVVFSAKYLNDNQTPLGLPEIGPATPEGLGIYIAKSDKVLKTPYICEMNFSHPTEMDAVRIDPAIIHRPGQSFPVRFSIQLMGVNGKVLRTSSQYKYKQLPNPGLNPCIIPFKRSLVTSLRLNVYEASVIDGKSNPIIQISEITPMLDGEPLKLDVNFKGSTHTPDRYSQRYEASDERLFWTLQSVYDGVTHTGKVVSQYEWVKGLALRQDLNEEQEVIRLRQSGIVATARRISIWVTSLCILCVILFASWISVRSYRRAKGQIKQMREQIACDLHDETGSSLAAIALHASKLRKRSVEGEEITSLNAILRLSKESVFGLREVLHATAPSVGREQDLLAYMHELAELTLLEIPFTFEAKDFSNANLTANLEIRKDLVLFYKEALINSQKSSQCSEVNIFLSNTDKELVVRFEDDGIGMSKDQLARTRALRTLKQRAERLNGSLKIETSPGNGMKLLLKAPLQ